MESLLLMIPAFIVVAIGALIYSFAKHSPDAQADDGSPMPAESRRLLVYYLLLFGSCIVYMVVSLNLVDLPETAVLPETTPSVDTGSVTATQKQNQEQLPSDASDKTVPILMQVFPNSTIGNTPSVSLSLYGRNFNKDSKVRFNMRERPFIKYIDEGLIRAQFETGDLVSTGSITVDVINPGNKMSNAIAVAITKPRAALNVFGFWEPLITREVQLLLLALVAGALGSYVHAIKSLADFIGNRTLTASWFWWYISRPFLGMAMALIFYAVLRAGFLTGTPADAKVINPFGVIAIGALVGMFADKAAQKLGEIFDTLFKSEDRRGGKLSAPVIDKLDPDTILPGQSQPVQVKIVGDRLGKVSGVRLNADERKPDTVSEKEVTFKLRPEDMANPAEIKITLVNPDGAVSTTATLHVTNLAITTQPPLANGTVGSDYNQPITASGGSTPYKWSLVNPPVWLKIDEQSGTLTGKPTTAGTSKISVRITDKSGAGVTKTYDLTVN
jgi:hypothetical protein